MNTPVVAAAGTRRFVARSSREALRLVREELGADAIVVSNRVTASGVEILVLPPHAVDVPGPTPAALPTAVAVAVAAAAPAPGQSALPAPAHSDSVLQEILSMRSMIEEQLAGRAWNEQQRRDPLRGHLLRALLGAGFSTRLARATLDTLPGGLAYAPGLDWVKSELARRLPVIGDDDALLDAGGVYALVGPTGVGKTTTTAKIAARCVMRFGPEKLALVTTDSYRIGAYEQLRIYGQILGVPVYAVKDAIDLRLVLEDLRDKHMVLIDTVGMSQRDRAVSDQIAMLCDASRPVRRLLLLNATSHGDTLDEVVHAYRRGGRDATASDLAGCILTKVDEASHPGAVIDTVIRHGLPVHYVSGGQKVPENLVLARPAQLMESMFQAASRSALFVPGEIDLQEQLMPLHSEAEVTRAHAVTRRLRAQCEQLVRALAHDARELATQAGALGEAGIGFACTQALWRSLADEGEAGETGAQAAMAQACAEVSPACGEHVLAVFGDAEPDSHESGGPQRLPRLMLLSDRTGLPLAAPAAAQIEWLRRQDFGKPVVLLLAGMPDASLATECHAGGLGWLARAPARLRVVDEDGVARALSALAGRLDFGPARSLVYRSRPALQSLADARVQLQSAEGAVARTGATLRLVVIRTVDRDSGKLLAQSYLLGSAGLEATAADLAQWQAWRSAARPCFKLMKDALHQLAGAASGAVGSSRRVLVAGQASTTVWRLQQAREAWAGPARTVLAQLAGRRVRPGRPIPAAVLFEGLGKFCVLLDALAADDATPLPAPAAAAARCS